MLKALDSIYTGRNILLGIGLSLLILAGGCPPPGPPVEEDLNPAVILFENLYKYHAAADPFVVAAADFDRDGRKDLVTANRLSDDISVLLAKSEGGFKTRVQYAAGISPGALVISHLNSDGFVDIVVANTGSSDVSVLLGNGDGTFQPEVRYPLPAGAEPLGMVLADFDGDGILDIATADYGIGSMSVLKGLGGGVFDVPARYLTGDRPRAILAADLNQDGIVDLLTTNRDTNDLTLFFGVGDGTFHPALSLLAGINPRMTVAIDLDGDGWLDLVCANPGSGDMSILMGLGGGLFSAEVRLPVAGYLPTRFVVADFNRDGIADLGVLLFSTGTNSAPAGLMGVYRGRVAGGFEAPRYFGVGLAALDLIAEDMDGDGIPDIVTAATGANQVCVVYGRGDGTFETEERFPTGRNPRMIRAGLLNGDAHLDLVVANLDSRDLTVLPGKGDGTFQAPSRAPLTITPRAIALGHLNGDTHIDIVAANVTGSDVAVLMGRGNGTFEAERRISVRAAGATTHATPRSVALGDINGDGFTDIVTGNANRDTLGILLGDGAGNFQPAVEQFIANFPLDVALVDLNRNGVLDVVCLSTNDPDVPTDQAQPRVVRMLGIADGLFNAGSTIRYATGAQPRALAVEDLNNDNRPDAVSVHPENNSVFLHRGQANGSLSPGERLRAGIAPNSVWLSDVNGDNRGDIITTNDGDFASVILNRGNLLFNEPMSIYVGASPIAGILADLDDDGAPDLIVANRRDNTLSVLMGYR